MLLLQGHYMVMPIQRQIVEAEKGSCPLALTLICMMFYLQYPWYCFYISLFGSNVEGKLVLLAYTSSKVFIKVHRQ